MEDLWKNFEKIGVDIYNLILEVYNIDDIIKEEFPISIDDTDLKTP